MNKNLNLKKSIALALALLFALIVWACGPSPTNNTGGNANTAGANNTNKGASTVACDDVQVIKDIQATIEAKYPLLKSRMTHLSAYSKGCSVSLMGYTDTLQNFKDFYSVASDTPNVVKVNIDKLFIDSVDVGKPISGLCPAGQQACGDICVPQGQCWSKNFEANANTNSNSGTNANSTNSNSYSNKARP